MKIGIAGAVVVMVLVAVVSLPAGASTEQWGQGGRYGSITIDSQDETRVLTRAPDDPPGTVVEVVDRDGRLMGSFRVGYGMGAIDMRGDLVVWAGSQYNPSDNDPEEHLVVADLNGEVLASRTWGYGEGMSVWDLAIWGDSVIVVQQGQLITYDLLTLEPVGHPLDLDMGRRDRPHLGGNRERLVLAISHTDPPVGVEHTDGTITFFDIGHDHKLSPAVGPLPIGLASLGVNGSPGIDGGFYVRHQAVNPDPDGYWAHIPVITHYSATGAIVETVQVMPAGSDGSGFDIDRCFNVVGVEHWSEPTGSLGFKWVPQNRDRGCFVDTESHTFEADIVWLGRQGITHGCAPSLNDRFCPDELVTRGQMAAFLVRALNLTDRLDDPFTDDDDSIFEADIERLAAAGITRGCNPGEGNTKFCPDDKVTREQMAAFLVRALEYTDDGGGDHFVDDDLSIFENDIDRLVTAGVTRGCNPPDNNRFCPTRNVTRGQMAAFLHRALG